MTTSLLMLLFSHHQPLSDARRMTCDRVLELLRVKLDEGLSYLEDENPRRARQDVQIRETFGSWEAFQDAAREEGREAPTL